MTTRKKFYLLLGGLYLSAGAATIFALLFSPWFGGFVVMTAVGLLCSSQMSAIAQDLIGNAAEVPDALKKVREWQKK